MRYSWHILSIFVLLSGLAVQPALADGGIGDEPEKSERVEAVPQVLSQTGYETLKEAENNGIIRLTPNKNKILRLDQNAASVIVSNPTHASILLDSPRLLVIIPRAPGATSFTVLNAQGKTILERDVVVTGVKPKYVRIRKSCSGGDAGCQEDTYFYCPDGCYEIGTQTIEGAMGMAPSTVPEIAGGGTPAPPTEDDDQQANPEPVPADALATDRGNEE